MRLGLMWCRVKSVERWRRLEVWVPLAVAVGTLTGLVVAALHYVIHILICYRQSPAKRNGAPSGLLRGGPKLFRKDLVPARG